MFDLYLDRNKNDKNIKNTFHALKIFIKENKNNNVQNYGTLIKNSKNKIAILWGLESKFKKNTQFRSEVKNAYSNIIVIELGFLNRNIYRAITLNEQAGLSFPKPIKCLNNRFDKLNLKIKPIQVKKNGYILFCGQVPWDRQVQFLNTNYETWVIKTLHQIRKTTNRNILFRFHPVYLKHIKKKGKKPMNLPNFVNIDQNKSILDSIKNAYVTVSYNSTALIDSIINGCPILALHQMSPVYELSTNKVENIENLYIPSEEEVLQNLYNISYMQWNLDEIKSGKPFNYLLSLI